MHIQNKNFSNKNNKQKYIIHFLDESIIFKNKDETMFNLDK